MAANERPPDRSARSAKCTRVAVTGSTELGGGPHWNNMTLYFVAVLCRASLPFVRLPYHPPTFPFPVNFLIKKRPFGKNSKQDVTC